MCCRCALKPTKETPAFNVPAGTVAAPVKGTVVAMENLPDETFAAGVLGKGVGVQPESGVVTAPFSGKVTQVAETGHAIGLESADGLEVLIHVGVDTVDMNGVGFTPKVKVGDTVRPGQEILAFDRAAIKKAGHPDVVVVMLTNADDFGTVECAPEGAVSLGGQIIQTKK